MLPCLALFLTISINKPNSPPLPLLFPRQQPSQPPPRRPSWAQRAESPSPSGGVTGPPGELQRLFLTRTPPTSGPWCNSSPALLLRLICLGRHVHLLSTLMGSCWPLLTLFRTSNTFISSRSSSSSSTTQQHTQKEETTVCFRDWATQQQQMMKVGFWWSTLGVSCQLRLLDRPIGMKEVRSLFPLRLRAICAKHKRSLDS